MNGKIEAHHADTADSPERVDDIRAHGLDELIGVKGTTTQRSS